MYNKKYNKNMSAAKTESIIRELKVGIVSEHLRQFGWDMKVSEYEKTGFSQNQIDPGHHPHEAR